jgi:hypothetical protein
MAKCNPIVPLLFLWLALACPAGPVRLDAPDPAWAPVFAGLASAGPVRCRFEEERRNPFHKLPKRFAGSMWWDPRMGLCLYYQQPSRLIVNVLPGGVLLGRPDEPLEPLPGSEQQQVMLLFSRLFNWDVEWLSANFETDGELDGSGGWRLSLRPLDAELAGKLTRIDLDGGNGKLQRIFLDLRGGRTVEIRLSEQTRVDRLSGEEISTAFPNHDGRP